ncbi:sodium/potassium/calcium exchanger 1-like [Cyrtonyx montezumae]|uniref:sodium/potassium/calcium exchanger 1-like n=1 Tax=Cyrtonyx montezumae TaxID=9017 RepID=UPI0032DB8094
MELVAELRAGGGRAREARVRCEAEAGGELRALQRGLSEMQERVAELLAPLVLEQRGAGGGAGPRRRGDGEDEEDEEEEEEEEEEDEKENGAGAARAELPPAKRTKVQPPCHEASE